MGSWLPKSGALSFSSVASFSSVGIATEPAETVTSSGLSLACIKSIRCVCQLSFADKYLCPSRNATD